MTRILRIAFLAVLLAAAPISTAAADSWEHIEQVRPDPSEGERIDVEVSESYIYVSTNKVVTVKICTILGQLVSQEKLPAGVSRIRLAQRGVYILKAGSITRRVNI